MIDAFVEDGHQVLVVQKFDKSVKQFRVMLST